MPVKLSCLDGIIIRILLKVFAAAAISPHPHSLSYITPLKLTPKLHPELIFSHIITNPPDMPRYLTSVHDLCRL